MEPITVSTACALLIGNELLNGSTDDCNLAALAQSLHSLGIRLKRALVLPDDVELLTVEIQKASEAYDVVFTSGGVGPTHDDVTIAAVAKAFNVDTVVNEELHTALASYYGEPLTEAHLRLAVVPRGACMVRVPETPWPTIMMRNVWVLPGVPAIFRTKLDTVKRWLKGTASFHSCAVVCRSDELRLKVLIDRAVLANPSIEIGSYPIWPPTEAQTKVTFEGLDGASLKAAVAQFVESLPGNDLLRIVEPSVES